MKRSLPVVFLISASCLGLPAVSAAQTTSPTVVLEEHLPGVSAAQSTGPAVALEEHCTRTFPGLEGVQVYGVDLGVTGFPPNTPFTGTISWQYINADGSLGPVSSMGPIVGGLLTTDANGEFIIFFGNTLPSVFTWTVDSPYLPGGTQSKTLKVTCEPTSKEQCKNGGWRNFPQFKNQGQCIAFVSDGKS